MVSRLFQTRHVNVMFQNLSPENAEALVDFAVSLIGTVEVSTVPVYSSEDPTPPVHPISKRCNLNSKHDPHLWIEGRVRFECPGRTRNVSG